MLLKVKQFLSRNVLACISFISFLLAIGFVFFRQGQELQPNQEVVNYWWLMFTQSDDVGFVFFEHNNLNKFADLIQNSKK